MRSILTLALAGLASARFDMWGKVTTNSIDGSGMFLQAYMTFYQTNNGNCECFYTSTQSRVFNLRDGSGDYCSGAWCDSPTGGRDRVLDEYTIRNTNSINSSKGQMFEYWNVVLIRGTGGGSYAVFGTNWDNNQYEIPIGTCRRVLDPDFQCFGGFDNFGYNRVLECDADVNFVPGEAQC